SSPPAHSPYPTLFRSKVVYQRSIETVPGTPAKTAREPGIEHASRRSGRGEREGGIAKIRRQQQENGQETEVQEPPAPVPTAKERSEEHTSELQSHLNL